MVHDRSRRLTARAALPWGSLLPALCCCCCCRVELDEDVPGHGKNFCITCSRYFVSPAALGTHEKTKEHRRRIKALEGPKPHNQGDADWAGGMGAPDNGPRREAAMAVDS